MDEKLKLGVVKNMENEIVGYNISEDIFVPLSQEEIAHALHEEAMRKIQYSIMIKHEGIPVYSTKELEHIQTQKML